LKNIWEGNVNPGIQMFEIDIERKTQNPFMIFMGQKRHADKHVLDAQEFIESTPQKYLLLMNSVPGLILAAEHSKESLKNAPELCDGSMYREFKVEFAKKQLETGKKTISEIIRGWLQRHRRIQKGCFKKHTDLSPVDYRKRYS